MPSLLLSLRRNLAFVCGDVDVSQYPLSVILRAITQLYFSAADVLIKSSSESYYYVRRTHAGDLRP